jgi:F-type H+-transporting ATPase subunit alpha
MALSLYAVNEGYLDDVTIGNVVAFEAEMHEHARGSHKAAIDAINAKPEYSDENIASLKKIVESYRQTSTLITASEEKAPAKK